MTAAPLLFVGALAAITLIFATLGDRITSRFKPMVEKYRLDLEQADVRVSTGQIVAVLVAISAMIWLALQVALRLSWIPSLMLAFVAFGLTVMIARAWLGGKQKKRLAKFNDQLEVVLRLMTSGLRAGLGLRQALVLVIDELDDPARTEFLRVVGQSNIGVSAYDALDGLARRMPSDECTMMVRSIRVQSQTGGNLAKVLDHLATTIRERRRVNRKMASLTAEGRMTAVVVLALPVVVFLGICAFQWPMASALVFTWKGHIILGGAFGLEFFGWLVLRSIMNFNV